MRHQEHWEVPAPIASVYQIIDSSECRRRWELLTSGAEGQEAAQAAMGLCYYGNSVETRKFCLWCFDAYQKSMISRSAFSAVLSLAWCDGRVGSTLTRPPRLPYRLIERMFDAAEADYLMSTDELEVYRKLPVQIKAYRGGSGLTVGKCRRGMSWTLDPSAAAWFACRYKGVPCCIEATIPKEAVLAAFDREDELVVRSGCATGVRRMEINERHLCPWDDRSTLLALA